MHVEVFPRRIPTEVRAKDTAGQEERLVVIAPQERSGALGGLPVGRFPFWNIQRLPIRPIFEIGVGHLVAHPMQQTFSVPGKRRPMPGRILMVPGYPVGELAMRFMKNLAARHGRVSMLAKVLRDRHPILEFRLVPEPRKGSGPTIPAFVTPDTDGRRPQSGHRRHSRGVAQRRRTIRLLEQHAPRCEPIDIGSLGLGMSSKTTNPVVQIVDGDEQDVRRFVFGKTGANQQQEAKKCEDRFHVNSFWARQSAARFS